MPRDVNNWRKQRDTSEHFAKHGRNPSPRVDLGLALLCMRAKRGIRLSRRDIAAWCGCTDANIYRIERRARVKISNAIGLAQVGMEMRTHL